MATLWKICALVLAIAGLSAAPAHAQTTAYAAGQGAVNRIEVGINVQASVRDRCGFATDAAPNGSVTQADFDRVGATKDFAIRLNCSGASRVAVSSLNGGLAHAETATGYASKAPYTVELRLVGDNGTTASASCAAAGLKAAGSCSFAGTASSVTGLKLGAAATKDNGSYLRVTVPPATEGEPLLAGTYSDTLTITVSVAA